MKKIIAFLFLFQLSFGQVEPEVTYVEYKDSVVESKKFDIGDVDNNKINDYATINISKNKDADANEVVEHMINIKFSNNDLEIGFYPCKAIYITKTADVNKDGSNDIIIFSKIHEGSWYDISLWTFKNKNWEEIIGTKGFCSDHEDFKNRVVKSNDKYFLIGEDWHLDKNGDFKKIKIRLKS